MCIYASVTLSGLPRITDFCVWGYAVAEALGGQGDAFLAAHTEAIGAQNSAALENHPVATAVLALLGGRDAIAKQPADALLWQGTAADLLTELEKEAETLKI